MYVPVVTVSNSQITHPLSGKNLKRSRKTSSNNSNDHLENMYYNINEMNKILKGGI